MFETGIILLVGFAIGFGVREAISRYRRAASRRRAGYGA